MPYQVTKVLLNTSTETVYKGSSLAGFPVGDFYFLLYSAWVCLGPNDSFGFTPRRTVQWSNTVVWGNISINHDQVAAHLIPGVSTTPIFDGQFAYAPANTLTHLLVSIAPMSQIIQVYVNDAPLTLTSGGWTRPGPFNLDGHFSQWALDGAGSLAPGPGAGDLFCAAPAAFYDLNIVANRRKFINADLSPVDLGLNASSVLGSPPPIYLTARSGNPLDFASNNGFGGPFDYFPTHPIILQDPASCVLAPPPPTPPDEGPPTVSPPSQGPPYLREMTYRHAFLGISFDPTIVITKDRPGPLRIVEFNGWVTQ